MKQQLIKLQQPLIIFAIIASLVWGHFQFPSFDGCFLMIVLISTLVIAHELGHFYVAKKVGVKVERFGIGLPFGPTLYEKQMGETTFCIHLALLGGYVSFPDDDPDSELPKDSPRRFENKSIAARAAIAIAGITVNFILGYFIMIFVIGWWGIPGDFFVSVHKFTSSEAPAAKAGMLKGDKFLEIDGKAIKTDMEALIKHISDHPNTEVKITIKRNGEKHVIPVIPDEKGIIGTHLMYDHEYTHVSNPVVIMREAYVFLQDKMILNFKAIGEIFTGKRGTEDVAGPIGIVKQGGMMIEVFGIREGLVITALISTILAIMNLLPIPALDGGHLLFLAIELLKGKPLKEEIREKLLQFSFVILAGLMIFIVCNDVFHHILNFGQ